jgi:hypothetical protein
MDLNMAGRFFFTTITAITYNTTAVVVLFTAKNTAITVTVTAIIASNSSCDGMTL